MTGFVLQNSMQLQSEQSLVLQGIPTSCNNSNLSTRGSTDELKILPELAASSDDDTIFAIAHK